MDGGGAHAVSLVAPVELDGEENVGRLRAAVGAEFGIGRAFEIGIVENPNYRGGVRPYALDPARARALWAKSEEMVGERFPA